MLAVAVTLAKPDAFVVAVLADKPALAPDPGAAKLTTKPLTGLLAASRTVTWSNAPKAVLTDADCGVPPVAVICVAAPAVLVSANVAVKAPLEAITL